MTTTSTRQWKPRSGSRRYSVMLALVVLAGSFTLAVARSEPASAWTEQRSPTEIVLTSRRFEDVGVRATVIVILRSNGDIVLRAHDVHNTARTRKFFWIHADLKFVEGGFGRGLSYPSSLSAEERIDAGETKSFATVVFEPRLAERWDRVLNGNIEADLSFHGLRSRI